MPSDTPPESPTPEKHDPKALLDSLRWKEDQCVTNHEGERVFLGPCYNSEGRQVGITDCCPEEYPCERHKLLKNKQN